MTTRVCIADALTVFRAAVRQVLDREKDFEVVEAADLAGLQRAIEDGVAVNEPMVGAGGVTVTVAVAATEALRPPLTVFELPPPAPIFEFSSSGSSFSSAYMRWMVLMQTWLSLATKDDLRR